jgi:hypothetical protein
VGRSEVGELSTLERAVVMSGDACEAAMVGVAVSGMMA